MPDESMVGAQWYNLTDTRGTSGGWDVELLYATGIDQAGDPNGSAAVGARAATAKADRGLRVLVRVDYAQGQSVPPPTTNDAARTEYVLFLQSICQDPAYHENVFGYIIGNEFNLRAENQQLNWPNGQRLTPDWYARICIGYDADPGDTGNAYSSIKTFQPDALVLVGPVAPWTDESGADGEDQWSTDEPWLNYFHAVCRRIASVGTSINRWPDGFAIHAYGRLAPARSAAFNRDEPHRDVTFGSRGAQGGFRVYQDWSAIIDGTGFDPSLPIFVTETNTFTDAHSSESYPVGWYLEALQELKTAGPRFRALCWFVDNDPSGGWEAERLTNPQGNCIQANADFDAAIAGGQ